MSRAKNTLFLINLVCVLLLVLPVRAEQSLVEPPGPSTGECAFEIDASPQSSGAPSDACMPPDDAGMASSQSLWPAPATTARQTLADAAEPPQSRADADRDGLSLPPIIVYLFWGDGCPHCEDEKRFLKELRREEPRLEVRDFEVWHNRDNAAVLIDLLRARDVRSAGIPVTLIGDRLLVGFSAQTADELRERVAVCARSDCGDPLAAPPLLSAPPTAAESSAPPAAAVQAVPAETPIRLPVLGELDPARASLPLLTLVLAGLDSFNPCAFFVLLTLLSLLVQGGSRPRMFLIGAVFVFFSGFIYFLFMAAWLNLFLLLGQVELITRLAGAVALLVAALNLKDFFWFGRGPSLSIPDQAKPKLFARMRGLLQTGSLPALLFGTSVLAIAANSYELLCTAGFPMVFTRVLTLHQLPPTAYYGYLVLYNLVYVVPLLLIVLAFVWTMGRHKLTAWQGRVLKLVSGAMMLGLGLLLLTRPALLGSAWASLTVLILALAGAVLIAILTRVLERKRGLP
ncbi:MAG: hypothetical protein RQ723_11795 [Desulfuromonadales bacterium]|nr:hypothetical protein [Desulfuromonadales bacterium]